jgi:drug/metabolite transporter (DMT)-like permease
LPSSRDNSRGILALIAATAAFTVNDTVVKLVTRELAAGEVIFVRGLLTAALLGIVVLGLGYHRTLRAAFTPIVLWRALLDSASSILFVLALAHMRIADVSAVVLAVPLILTAASVVLYREAVGWRRWSAVITGFVGVLLVVKPTPAGFDAWALVALGSAFASAGRDLVTRRIGAAVPSLTITFVGAGVVALTGLLMMPVETWRVPTTIELGWLALAACFLGLATFFVTRAFRGVDIAVVAPFRYTLLIWALTAGYMVFGELPDAWAAAGAVLIVGSGLYVLRREALRRRLEKQAMSVH